MTVIRLDAATLAAVKAATGPVYFAGETGEPVVAYYPHPVSPPARMGTGGYQLSADRVAEMIARVRAVAGDGPEATDEEMDAMMKDDR
jgi:hypothetical protein